MSTILTCHRINQSKMLVCCSSKFQIFTFQKNAFYIIAGVLVSLHRKPQNRSSERFSKSEISPLNIGDARCGHGDLNKEALQQVIAAKWAVDVINAQSGPNDLKIGKTNFSKILV